MRNAILSALYRLAVGLRSAWLSTDALRAWSERQAEYEWRIGRSPRLQAAIWATYAVALALFAFSVAR